MPISKKELILNILKEGDWCFETLSPHVLEIVQIQNNSFAFPVNSLKNNLIFYYNKIISPFESLFYCNINNVEFNTLLVSKINKSSIISSFSVLEQQKIRDSLEYIKTIKSGHSKFIEELSFVKMISSDFKSASNPHFTGVIFLTNQLNFSNNIEVTRSIVHELAHNELFLINFYDRLILDNFDNELSYSPYQKTNRPPLGRLHSMWALFRMIQYDKIVGKSVHDEFDLFKSTDLTLKNDIMSDYGKSLIKTIRVYLEKNN